MSVVPGGPAYGRVPPAPPPPPPPPMTLYDVLRKLIANESWSEQERRDAFALIGELERLNVFGNLAAAMTTPDHDGGPTP